MYANSHRGLRSKHKTVRHDDTWADYSRVFRWHLRVCGPAPHAGLSQLHENSAGVVGGVHDEFDGANATRAMIRSSISRRFDIESVGEITARDVKVTKVDGGYEVAATYSHKAPFVANVSFIVDFDKRVLVRR